MALRSRLSAASCFWRADQRNQARRLFDTLIQNHPGQSAEIRQIISELTATEKLAQARDSRAILLQQAGVFAEDETLDELRKAIYAARGRPEI